MVHFAKPMAMMKPGLEDLFQEIHFLEIHGRIRDSMVCGVGFKMLVCPVAHRTLCLH